MDGVLNPYFEKNDIQIVQFCIFLYFFIELKKPSTIFVQITRLYVLLLFYTHVKTDAEIRTLFWQFLLDAYQLYTVQRSLRSCQKLVRIKIYLNLSFEWCV